MTRLESEASIDGTMLFYKCFIVPRPRLEAKVLRGVQLKKTILLAVKKTLFQRHVRTWFYCEWAICIRGLSFKFLHDHVREIVDRT